MGKALPATHPVVAGATMLREQLEAPFPLQSVETGHATKKEPPQFITADLPLRVRRGCHTGGITL